MMIRNIDCKLKKFTAFTLAEMLLALGILGVISALIMPTLMANYQKRGLLLSLEKTYSEFSQAIDLFMLNEYAKNVYKSKLSLKGDELTDDNLETSAGHFLKNYFRITQNCGTDDTPCFANSYKTLNGSYDDFACDGYAVALENGSSICLKPAESGEKDLPATVIIDVNGPKKPNTAGRDVFTFHIYYDGTIDENVSPKIKNGQEDGDPETIREENFTNNCATSITGEGCFGKILNDNWQMNY